MYSHEDDGGANASYFQWSNGQEEILFSSPEKDQQYEDCYTNYQQNDNYDYTGVGTLKHHDNNGDDDDFSFDSFINHEALNSDVNPEEIHCLTNTVSTSKNHGPFVGQKAIRHGPIFPLMNTEVAAENVTSTSRQDDQGCNEKFVPPVPLPSGSRATLSSSVTDGSSQLEDGSTEWVETSTVNTTLTFETTDSGYIVRKDALGRLFCGHHDCQTSQKTWDTRAAVGQHWRTHKPSSGRPYACRISCGKRFQCPGEEKRHQSVHGARAVCPQCGALRSMNNLNRHVGSQHPGAPKPPTVMEMEIIYRSST